VRNDAFFQAIPLVLAHMPRTLFVCPAMKGSAAAQSWVDRLNIADSVRLLPAVAPDAMAALFRGAQITVSPAIHDGTPNSLLEAMACGCLPVTGDIESMRESIADGVNGLLCNPNEPPSIARAILRGLDDAALRDRARTHNSSLIAERAEYGRTMHRVESFYETVLERARRN
jgi:glycosyltransferase involved in cell wall biosynthesis